MDHSLKRVFVVDDDDSIRTSLSRLLKAAGYGVQAFASGEAFLAHITPGLKGCLVLDVGLPGMSGLELNERLVKLEVPLPIIFITACETPSARERAERYGSMKFLLKPFEDEALLSSIRLFLK